MAAVLSQKRLKEMYVDAARSVTEKLMGIVLTPDSTPINGEVCTVYTTFARGLDFGLAFCTGKKLAVRMTRSMMQREQVSAQDVEDYLKEYLNVLCGQITGAVFREAKIGARFQIPEFYRGWYEPENMKKSWEVSFLSDQNEGAWMIHYDSPEK